MNIPFIIWSPTEIKTSVRALEIIHKAFPLNVNELSDNLSSIHKITHVIAGTEASVIPASKIRIWLDCRRNPHSIITRCADKLIMKTYLKNKGIPMTDFISGREAMQNPHVLEKLGTPVVAKPRISSGGRGLKVIEDTEKLISELSEDILLEKKIEGTEGSVEAFIIDGKIYFTNITEYLELGHCNLVPGRYEAHTKKNILDLNQRVIESLKIQWGMTHLEFYLKKDGLLFGEIALRPPGGYIMELLEIAYHRNFWELFVQIELGMNPDPIENIEPMYTSSIVIYPPVGVVTKIEGIKEVEGLESLKKFKLKLKVDLKIPKKEGLGKDFGHALLVNTDQKKLLDDMDSFKQTLKIKTS